MNGRGVILDPIGLAGAVFVRLDKIASITTGARPSDDQLASGGSVAYLNGGVKPSGYVDTANTPGDSIAIPSRGSVGVVGYSSEPFWCGPLCYRVRSTGREVLNRFLYFALKSRQRDLVALQQTGSIPALNKKELAEVMVPVPPLEVQHEIVRILDHFTALESELEAELEARRLQYEHYRSRALDFSTAVSVRWSTLGEVSAKVSSGGTPPTGREAYYGGEIPWLRTQEVDFCRVYQAAVTITEEGLRNSSAKWIPEHCVIVAMYGATAAKVAINEIPLTTNQACCNLQIDPAQADYRYVFYWVASQYERLKSLGEGSQSNLNARKVKGFPIPVPSLKDQRRIVAVLDPFDALVNDRSVGLPAEIKARGQQYEYYLNKLMTFSEATV